jgi:hypothetical protein
VGIEKREQAAQNQDFSDPVFDLAKQFAAADRMVVGCTLLGSDVSRCTEALFRKYYGSGHYIPLSAS